MDSLDLLVAEAVMAERQREAEAASQHRPVEQPQRQGIRHTLASTFVRVGLRLDPGASEGLFAFDTRTAGQEGGC